ncbi:hypothetical protein GCM10010492_77560 [Saccharothrix mutabilis subsp. mutabilis]|uniref:Uncharacterized protein n=1 Tax=Saccharothrix mutabilis subsp. mutabilis TaxID=66855 RepID=A0ABP3EJ66_9PSEU
MQGAKAYLWSLPWRAWNHKGKIPGEMRGDEGGITALIPLVRKAQKDKGAELILKFWKIASENKMN